MADALLQITNLRKSYGANEVLKGIDFTVGVGERVALLGSNGAGKSTLVKIIAGDLQDWSGRVLLGGVAHHPLQPLEATRRGVTLMYQELETLPDLTVRENIVLGNEPGCRGLVSRAAESRAARAALDRIGADVPLEARVGDLTPAGQQLVMLARALCFESRLLILDEPTALLTQHETDRLFAVLDDLTAHGVAILYISHRIQELFRLGGRIAVMRDGVLVGTVEPDPAKAEQLVRMMSGRAPRETREPGEKTPRGADRAEAGPLLEVKSLSTATVHDVSLSVRAGEILGIGGLVGSGRSELLRAVAGLDRPLSGKVRMRGKAVAAGDPRAAWSAGIVLTPEDRKGEAVFQDFSLARNVVLPRLADMAAAGTFVTDRTEHSRSLPALRQAGVRPPAPSMLARELSGGNQQKLVFARSLMGEASVLLLDEPTRGVDVAAKQELFDLIWTMAGRGCGIVFVSSELDEVARIADRVLVLHEGRLIGELPGTCSEEEILSTIFVANQEETGT